MFGTPLVYSSVFPVYSCRCYINNIANMDTVSKLLQRSSLVKVRLNKSSTVVVKVASIVGNPFCIVHVFKKVITCNY